MIYFPFTPCRCYQHGHSCALTKHIKKWSNKRLPRYRRTEQRKQYIQQQGFTVESIWECEFYNLKKQDPELKQFIAKR